MTYPKKDYYIYDNTNHVFVKGFHANTSYQAMMQFRVQFYRINQKTLTDFDKPRTFPEIETNNMNITTFKPFVKGDFTQKFTTIEQCHIAVAQDREDAE